MYSSVYRTGCRRGSLLDRGEEMDVTNRRGSFLARQRSEGNDGGMSVVNYCTYCTIASP